MPKFQTFRRLKPVVAWLLVTALAVPLSLGTDIEESQAAAGINGCVSSNWTPKNCRDLLAATTTITLAGSVVSVSSGASVSSVNNAGLVTPCSGAVSFALFTTNSYLTDVSSSTIAGLSFSTSQGSMSGTALGPFSTTVYYVLGECSTDTTKLWKGQISITVSAPTGVPYISPSSASISGTVGTAITDATFTPNSSTGSCSGWTFAMSDSTPPAGLSYTTPSDSSATTFRISGTPTATASVTRTLTATCASPSESATSSITISISSAPQEEETTSQSATIEENVKVTLCHRTHAETNPYVRITVSVNAVNRKSGHSGHDEIFGDAHVYTAGIYKRAKDKLWGDIIPPDPTGQNRWQALNWTPLGQQIFNGTVAGCKSQSPQEYYNKLRESGVPAKEIKSEIAELEAEQELPVKTNLGPLEYNGTDPVALEEDKDKVTICHRTAATTNPYRKITVAASSIYKRAGHLDHNDSYLGNRIFNPSITYPANQKKWGDIIPPDPTGKNRWTALNWSAAGQAIYNGTVAGCSEQSSQEYYNAQREDGKPKTEVMKDLERQNNVDDDPHEVDGTQYTGDDPEVEKTEPREPEFPEGKPEIVQSLSGIVWLDLNRDGLKDSNEPLMPNIVLSVVQVIETASASTGKLSSSSLSPASQLQPAAVTTVLTDKDGFYVFPSLAAGGWQVVAGIPNQLTVTYDSQGTADGAVKTTVPAGGKAFTWVGLVGENTTLNQQLVTQIRGGSFTPAVLNGGSGVRPGQTVGPNGSNSGPQLAATGSNELYWILFGLLLTVFGGLGLRRSRNLYQ